MSSCGKRQRGEGVGPASSSSHSPASNPNLTILKCADHAAKLLTRKDDLRHSHPELLDLPTRLVLRTTGESGAEITNAETNIMAAASPFILSKLARWRDEQEEGGSGGGSSSLSSASSSSSSSSSSSATSSTATADDDEPTQITITIPELGAAALSAAVQFAYTGTVVLDPARKDDAVPLLAGFQLLDMEDAIEIVAEWVGSTLDPTTALRVRHTAESLHMGVLKARAEVYIDTNFEAVTKTEEWEMLPAEAVEEVLTRDELRPSGEINVFHALVRWGRGGEGEVGAAGGGGGCGGESKEGDQEDSREAQFVDLLGRCVRAARLSSHELSAVVLKEPLVQVSATALLSMVRVLQERTVDPSHSALFASPEPLCRRRADEAVVTKIFAVGGFDGTTFFSSVECLDPSTGQSSAVADMNTARANYGVAVVKGKLYAVGGQDEDDTTLSSVECFDPSTGLWSALADMSTARAFVAVVALECPE